MAADPVCGMQVEERTAAGSSVFAGGNYYFCSTGCKKKFDANPAAYIGAPATADTKRPEHARPHARTAPKSSADVHDKPVGAAAAEGTNGAQVMNLSCTHPIAK